MVRSWGFNSLALDRRYLESTETLWKARELHAAHAESFYACVTLRDAYIVSLVFFFYADEGEKAIERSLVLVANTVFFAVNNEMQS